MTGVAVDGRPVVLRWSRGSSPADWDYWCDLLDLTHRNRDTYPDDQYERVLAGLAYLAPPLWRTCDQCRAVFGTGHPDKRYCGDRCRTAHTAMEHRMRKRRAAR